MKSLLEAHTLRKYVTNNDISSIVLEILDYGKPIVWIFSQIYIHCHHISSLKLAIKKKKKKKSAIRSIYTMEMSKQLQICFFFLSFSREPSVQKRINLTGLWLLSLERPAC